MNSKYDWDQVPSWANYVWVGMTGRYFCGYKKPKWSWISGTYVINESTKVECILDMHGPMEWSRKFRKSSLESRP